MRDGADGPEAERQAGSGHGGVGRTASGREPPDVVEELRLLREQWLATLARAADAWLRNPAFLAWMRCSLGVITAAKLLCSRRAYDVVSRWEQPPARPVK